MLFAKLCTLALALPLVSAFTFGSTSGWTAGATVTITWTASTTDPTTFSIELANPSYHNSYAIASDVPTANGQITITLPQVLPGDGYSLQAVSISNVNDIIYQSPGTFVIGATSSSSASDASTTSTPATTVSTPVSTSSATFSTPSVTPTIPVSTPPAVTTPGTSSVASATPSTFNSSGAAASFKLAGVVPAVALVLSAVAGAVMVF
ncbi:hypothetical protein OG21DRAFT_328578 [Imleria badia]|nr:hypothetical protein OG21DRAFT_328578 [Imleria badia]